VAPLHYGIGDGMTPVLPSKLGRLSFAVELHYAGRFVSFIFHKRNYAPINCLLAPCPGDRTSVASIPAALVASRAETDGKYRIARQQHFELEHGQSHGWHVSKSRTPTVPNQYGASDQDQGRGRSRSRSRSVHPGCHPFICSCRSVHSVEQCRH